MSNRQTEIHKTFYDDYPIGWQAFSRNLRLKVGECQFCGHDGSGSNILTVAHLDQNTKNNSEENLKVLCRSCHIQFDQKYHNFSQMAGKGKVDNSNLDLKVDLRLEVVNKIDKDKITVFEAYAGDGIVWSKVKEKADKEIQVLKVEKKGQKKGFYLQGENEKFISLFDFSHFDIIDLDAYGIPYDQLKVVFEKEFKGFVIVTLIRTHYGRIPSELIKTSGITDAMIKKIPSLFSKGELSDKIIDNFLYLGGAKELIGYFLDRKHYFYFKLN